MLARASQGRSGLSSQTCSPSCAPYLDLWPQDPPSHWNQKSGLPSWLQYLILIIWLVFLPGYLRIYTEKFSVLLQNTLFRTNYEFYPCYFPTFPSNIIDLVVVSPRNAKSHSRGSSRLCVQAHAFKLEYCPLLKEKKLLDFYEWLLFNYYTKIICPNPALGINFL